MVQNTLEWNELDEEQSMMVVNSYRMEMKKISGQKINYSILMRVFNLGHPKIIFTTDNGITSCAIADESKPIMKLLFTTYVFK